MATAINLANLSMSFDYSKVKNGADITRKEINSISRIMRETEPASDKYNRDLEALRKGYEAGAIGAERYAKAIEHIKQKYGQGVNVQPVDAAGGDGMSLSAAGLLARFGGPIAIAMAAKQSLQLAAGVEQAATAFEVLTGSADRAMSIVTQMRALDAQTPVSFVGIQQAGKTLLGYGMAAEMVIPSLKQLADISMGDEERFKSLALAFGQVQAAGRLTGQEVLQMVNNGFNPLQEISRTTGRSMVELKAEMEAGRISFQMVADALRSATEEGGRFVGMSERMAQTVSGKWSKLVSDVQRIGIEIGQALEGPAKTGLSALAFGAEVAAAGASKLKDGFNFIGDAIVRGPVNALDDYQTKQQEAILSQERFQFLAGQTADEFVRQAEKMREIADLAAKSERSEYEKRTELQRQSLVNETKAIQDRYSRSVMSEADYQKMRLRMHMDVNRMTADDHQRIKDAEFAIDSMAGERDREKKRREDEALIQQKTQEMKRIQEASMSPAEKLKAELKNITDLQTKYGMDETSAFRARLKAFENFDNQKRQAGRDVSATIAPALKAGSVEAYKFILGQRDRAAETAERQLRTQERIAKATEESARAMANMPKIGAAR